MVEIDRAENKSKVCIMNTKYMYYVGTYRHTTHKDKFNAKM